MKELHLQLPDRLAEAVDALVRDGWFSSETEIARLALAEFVRHRRFALAEQFQREDIAWALSQRDKNH